MAEIIATLGQLVEAEVALARVSATDGMTAKTKYCVARLVRLVGVETAHFHAERQKLFQQLGRERPTREDERPRFGLTVTEVPPENVIELQAKLGELAQIEVTLPVGPVRSVDLPSATAADYIALGQLCELVEPE